MCCYLTSLFHWWVGFCADSTANRWEVEWACTHFFLGSFSKWQFSNYNFYISLITKNFNLHILLTVGKLKLYNTEVTGRKPSWSWSVKKSILHSHTRTHARTHGNSIVNYEQEKTDLNGESQKKRASKRL